MVHTLDPFAIKLWGEFGIRWYGLSYIAGFAAAYCIILFMVTKGRSALKRELVSDFVFTVALGTVIGGRLGYCIFYSPELFTRFSSSFPFWGVLAVNEGGMASHGGIAGIIAAAVIFGKKHGFSPLHAVDLCALTGPVGVFFGRIANFVNGELIGRPAAPDFPLAVRFPQDILSWPGYEPERLASLSQAVPLIGVNSGDWQGWIQNFSSNRHSWQMIEATLNSLITAVQSGNPAVTAALAPLLTPRHPSQLYEAALEGALLFVMLAFIWRKPRKPGIIMSSFLCLYSIVRIIGEQFRMPDAQIGFQALGLTRGQWLSIAMLLIGLVCLTWCMRRKESVV